MKIWMNREKNWIYSIFHTTCIVAWVFGFSHQCFRIFGSLTKVKTQNWPKINEYTHFEFWFGTGNHWKIQNWSILGILAGTPICLKRPALWSPNTWIGNFFIKQIPFQFGFCTGNCWTFLKLVLSGLIGRQTPFCQNGPQCGAQIQGEAFF